MKRKALILLLIIGIAVVSTPIHVFAYGGDGGGATDDFGSAGAWGVSWAPNPNGSDVMGSSIWQGRPENVTKGPYQPDKAVEDAEAELLSGYQSGTYTAEEVKTNLEWAQHVGIKISAQAQQTLNNILHPPAPAAPASSSSSSGSLSDKDLDKIAQGIDFIANYNKQKQKNKQQGLKTTKTDLAVVGLKKGIKDNVSSSWHQTVDDVFNFFGY